MYIFLAFSASPDPGFFAPSSPNIPLAVREASQAVFRFEFPSEPAFLPGSERGVKSLSAWERRVGRMASFEKSLLIPQIERCKKKPNSLCTIWNRGTAFLVKDSSTLWSALHNVTDFFLHSAGDLGIDLHDGISLAELESLKKIPLPVRLINYQGEVLFGEPGDYAYLDSVNNLFFEGFSFLEYPNFFDYVQLRLSRQIKNMTPIPITENLPPIGDQVYLIGFPTRSEQREKYKAPNSNGSSLYISCGPVLSLKEGNLRWDIPFEIQNPTRKHLSLESELHYEADCISGHSGGPVLNSLGEVIGLHNSSTSEKRNHYDPQGSCYSVRSSFLINGSKLKFE
jgi:hypothetical protein